MPIQVKILPAFYFLLTQPAFEKSLDSGRGCAKSTTVADCILIKCLQSKQRVLCAREIQNSIKQSVKKLLEDRIAHWGLWDCFDRTETEIRCRYTGSEIFFAGLHRNIDSVKSMQGITLVWIEEAQSVSQQSLEVLLPTIRTPCAEIWYTWNPTNREDAVYKRFYSKVLPEDCIAKHLTIADNPFFPKELRRQMEFDYKHNPERADHVWGGRLAPSGNAMAVMPRNWLEKAVDAHIGLDFGTRYRYMGFDIADTGCDHNALCVRNGAVIEHVEQWDSQFIAEGVAHADLIAKQQNVIRVYFDATGVGAGAKGDFNRITDRTYKAHPFIGASQPSGYDHEYLQGITNGKYFRNLKAQAWWNLRLRLENTLRLLDGEKIEPNNCLFISSAKIAKLEDYLSELSQASYEQEDGKLMVDKSPDDSASPNMADATVLSFAHDIVDTGLRGD